MLSYSLFGSMVTVISIGFIVDIALGELYNNFD
jgi:hypothetical protein